MSRYSQLYIERGQPASDSDRARIRLLALFADLVPEGFHGYLASYITRELGIRLETTDNLPREYSDIFSEFFAKCNIRDLLDCITVIYDYMKANDFSPYTSRENSDDLWHSEVGRIFKEENLAYQLDNDAIVHPYIDAEFESNRKSALEALSSSMFGEARTDFEAAYQHLRGREYKQAIRMMFPAVEVAAKVLFPGAFTRLMPNEVDRHIRTRLERRYAGNEVAISAGRLLLEGLKSWIRASQPYRHGQEQSEPAEPPEDFVIAHLSAGATYLRWMIDFCST